MFHGAPRYCRFACSEFDCQYCTIDSVMLQYHIQALHPHLDSYSCPHCRESMPVGDDPQEYERLTSVPFNDLEFHLRCHGELLFKCGHCRYYHWQKRTAEAHVGEEHPERKQFVRNVRVEEQEKAAVKKQKEEARKLKPSTSRENQSPAKPVRYLPFKCGLCEEARETEAAVKLHCAEAHDLHKRFLCALCGHAEDDRAALESHLSSDHAGTRANPIVALIRTFYIEQYSAEGADERREPLWKRDMPGVKHIRGILYDEEGEAPAPLAKRAKKYSTSSSSLTPAESQLLQAEGEPKASSMEDEVDNFPMKCKECGLPKKTIKALKMHIKLMHLRSGKYR